MVDMCNEGGGRFLCLPDPGFCILSRALWDGAALIVGNCTLNRSAPAIGRPLMCARPRSLGQVLSPPPVPLSPRPRRHALPDRRPLFSPSPGTTLASPWSSRTLWSPPTTSRPAPRGTRTCPRSSGWASRRCSWCEPGGGAAPAVPPGGRLRSRALRVKGEGWGIPPSTIEPCGASSALPCSPQLPENREGPSNVDHSLAALHSVWLSRVALGWPDDDLSLARIRALPLCNSPVVAPVLRLVPHRGRVTPRASASCLPAPVIRRSSSPWTPWSTTTRGTGSGRWPRRGRSRRRRPCPRGPALRRPS